MPAIFYRSLRQILIIIVFMLLSSLFASAQINNIKEEARIYRDEGYEAQSSGDLDTAMSYYQKAIELNPNYVAVYNDLGVIYEIKGFKDRALETYLKCVKIDPYYQSAYFNLANLYEEKGDLRKAADYWKKRIQIGDPNDPWTKKAQQHLQKIGMLVEDIGQQLKHQEQESLVSFLDFSNKKGKARSLFINAKVKYLKGDYPAALKDAALAQSFDPSDSEIERFVDNIRKKMLTTYNQ